MGVIYNCRVDVHSLPTGTAYSRTIPSPNLNIFLSRFTTCWARPRLYGALELLGERVPHFYFVLYVKRPGLPDPVLGEFTSEIDGGDYITEFVFVSYPKNYGLRWKGGVQNQRILSQQRGKGDVELRHHAGQCIG